MHFCTNKTNIFKTFKKYDARKINVIYISLVTCFWIVFFIFFSLTIWQGCLKYL